nr:DNA methyltransferase [Bacillus subtilis]
MQRVWRWGKKKASEGLNDEIVGYKTDSGEYRVVQKTRLTGKVIRSLQLDTEISSRKGTGEVESLFGRKIFSFPKPIELIRRFAAISTSEEDLILDFFSGSSSTAHAILKLNSEDNDSITRNN